METAHLVEVLKVACRFRAGAIEGFDGAQVRALAFGPALRDARGSFRAQTFQNPAGASEVLFHPDRMVFRHRLAPVREDKVRILLLRVAKRARGIVVLEVVELGQPVEERRLRRGRAGVGEGHVADARRLRRRRERRYQDETKNRSGETGLFLFCFPFQVLTL